MKFVLCMAFIAVAATGCSGSRPKTLGLKNGSFAPCPDSPNCVSSQGEGDHYIDPIKYRGSREKARTALLDVLADMKRTTVITSEDSYIHAECRSALFRFVDDLELYVDPSDRVIHVRSASRVGYSDMGVNRKRVEALRKAFQRKFEALSP